MTLEELEKRIKTLEDIEEIKQLQGHYVNCLIQVDWDGVIDCFSDNGVVDLHAGMARGKKEMEELFKVKIARVHIGMEGEFAVHPIISVDGDRAKGSWLLYIQFVPHKLEYKPEIIPTNDAPDWQQGFYEMEYVRENGKWKISLLKWRLRLMSPMPPSTG